MADLLANEVKYAIADPFGRTKVHETETAGTLPVGRAGLTVVDNPEVAAEIKDKNPHFVVSEMRGFIPKGRTMFVMPELPYRREKERKRNDDEGRKTDLQQGVAAEEPGASTLGKGE